MNGRTTVEPEDAKLEILVVVDRASELEYTFIQNHISGLVSAGHHIRTLCLRNDDGSPLFRLGGQPPDDSRGAPVGLRTWLRIAAMCAAWPPRIRCLYRWRLFAPLSCLAGLISRIPGAIRADLIHSHFGPAGAMIEILVKLGLLTGRQAVSFHGYDINTGTRRRLQYRHLFHEGAVFFVNSVFSARRIAELGCPRATQPPFPALRSAPTAVSGASRQKRNPLFPALRSAPTAVSGASRQKQIPSSQP
jgi:hypothetical protein